MAYTPVHDHAAFDSSTVFSLPAGNDQFAHAAPHVASPENNSQPFPLNDGVAGYRKDYADVDLRGEVSPYWAGLPAVAASGPPLHPHHQRGWSDSTIATTSSAAVRGGDDYSDEFDDLDTTAANSSSKLSTHKHRHPRTKKNRHRVLCGSTTKSSWTLETVAVAIALAAVGAVLGVLGWFNGQPLPDWPYDITLNALIALLVTVATAGVGVALQGGLGQLKWVRFTERRAPLADLERFDEASRGTWGAVKLLGTGRGGYLGSFGAVVAITALGLSPFAQQVVTYQTRTVESPEGASVNRALNYTGALPGNTSSTGFVPLLPLKSAVYNGLFAENGRPGASLAFACPTGNCTWAAYETLAVCASCVDLTPFIEPDCSAANSTSSSASDAEDCGWKVPQGASLRTRAEVFSLTAQIPPARGALPHSTIARLLFMGSEAREGGANGGSTVQPWAKQCTFSACVQTLSSRVSAGALTEAVQREAVNTSVVDISDASADRDVYTFGADAAAPPYVLSIEAMLAMRGWFSALFARGGAVRSSAAFNRTITASPSAVVVNLTVGIASGTTFFDSDVVTAFYWNYYEYAGGIDMLVRDVATSVTVAFRGFLGAVPVAGSALAAQPYVHVRWGFAALPIVVVLAAAAFLGGAVWSSRRAGARTWKSSALAVLFHGLDDEMRERVLRGKGEWKRGDVGLGELKRRAQGVKVQLDEAGDASLLRG
ncbi:hypothetical protein F4810DRAFT_716606 [Camillea tinctor]|nr:hypothetical protein F4810DRAFT_716606 [Camillea tinctor]